MLMVGITFQKRTLFIVCQLMELDLSAMLNLDSENCETSKVWNPGSIANTLGFKPDGRIGGHLTVL